MKGKILIALIIILAAIQFIRPEKNKSAELMPGDITTVYDVPGDVNNILKKACNDCHSNNTVYPWYAEMQPVGWWLNHHIVEGKEELNFSEFAHYPVAVQYHKLEEMIEQIKEDEMPLSSYTLIHIDARLTDAEKQSLLNWSQSVRDTIKAKYPADSLVLKRRAPK